MILHIISIQIFVGIEGELTCLGENITCFAVHTLCILPLV